MPSKAILRQPNFIVQFLTKIITPGKASNDAPSDAIVLFDGKNLDEWVTTQDTSKAADWIMAKNIITVNKKVGNIQTKKSFTDYQLHINGAYPPTLPANARPVETAEFF